MYFLREDEEKAQQRRMNEEKECVKHAVYNSVYKAGFGDGRSDAYAARRCPHCKERNEDIYKKGYDAGYGC